MRATAAAIPVIATLLTAAPAQAQTYDPTYPVCLQAYGDKGGYIECRYTSLAQCQMSASGRAAQCMVNPFFSHAYQRPPPGRAYPRRHHSY